MRTAIALVVLSAALLAQEGTADPRRLSQLLADGSQALASGRLDDLDRILAAATPLGPDIRVEILRSELLIARKDAGKAAATMGEAILKLKPEGEWGRTAHRTHARALVENGNYREAAPALLKSLGLDAKAAAALALAARGFAEGGDRRLARGLLAVVVNLDPARTELLKTRAGLALEDGDPHDALRDAETVIARAPADADARRIRARALHALGRTMEARDALAALDRAMPLDPALLRVLGALDIEAGLLPDAQLALLRIGPLQAADAAVLASAWLERGSPREGLRVLDLVDGSAGIPDLVRLRAAIHVELGEYGRAAELLRTLTAPTLEDQIAIARAERLAGNAAAAIAILEPLLARDPGNLAARSELVFVRIMEGDFVAARRILAEGLVLAPHHPDFVRALEDLVVELAPPESATVVAALHRGTLMVDGTKIDAEIVAGLGQLRGMRVAFGTSLPAVRLVLQSPVDASALQRALDLLGAAGFSRVSVEAK